MAIEEHSFDANPRPDEGVRFGGTDSPRPRKKGWKFVRSNLLLIALFPAGIGCVYVLKLPGHPETASAELLQAEEQVTVAISMMRDPKFLAAGKADTVIRTFAHSAKQRQIPIEKRNGNPFVFKRPETAKPKPVRDVTPTKTPKDDYEFKEKAEALNVAQKLVLQSILKSPRGATAMISGNVLSEGQTIYGWTVNEIKAQKVILKWKELEHVLGMEH